MDRKEKAGQTWSTRSQVNLVAVAIEVVLALAVGVVLALAVLFSLAGISF